MCGIHSVMFDSLWLFVTVAYQASLSIGFSKQEYWSGLNIGGGWILEGVVITPFNKQGSAQGDEHITFYNLLSVS